MPSVNSAVVDPIFADRGVFPTSGKPGPKSFTRQAPRSSPEAISLFVERSAFRWSHECASPNQVIVSSWRPTTGVGLGCRQNVVVARLIAQNVIMTHRGCSWTSTHNRTEARRDCRWRDGARPVPADRTAATASRSTRPPSGSSACATPSDRPEVVRWCSPRRGGGASCWPRTTVASTAERARVRGGRSRRDRAPLAGGGTGVFP